MSNARIIVVATVIVVFLSVVATSFGADLVVPPRLTDPRCATASRYEVMSRAYELHLPDPCNPRARVWIR